MLSNILTKRKANAGSEKAEEKKKHENSDDIEINPIRQIIRLFYEMIFFSVHVLFIQ